MPTASENLDTCMKIEMNVHSVYPNFLKNLSAKHGILNSHEIKICMLIVLKRSSIEIKEIMEFKEVHAVHSASSRLRDKFGLSEDEHLISYLLMVAEVEAVSV